MEWVSILHSAVEWALLDWRAFLRLVLDLVVVFSLIYGLLVLVRGTRAERMLIGLGVIAFVNVAARELHLSVLHWILQNFLNSVIVVVVVIFQDDFRRALTKVGLIPGFGSDVLDGADQSIKEIAKAANELSSRRIGGLIVVRREVGLDDYYEQAVRVDAVASHQLLVSIFLPTSPLHDGAVVIEGDRVVAAGAVLPLSFNPALSSTYGTRHRAAVGLSERTDAVIVVISEETGAISLVREGRISTDYDERSLTTALWRLTAHRSRRKRIREKIKASLSERSARGEGAGGEG